MSVNQTPDNYINYIKKNIQNKEEMISKKTSTIYTLFKKWEEDYETYLYTAIPICNEIDKLKDEIDVLYNNYQEYFEEEYDEDYDEEYEKQWDELDRLEWQRD